jgi:hypothetical protein
LSLSTVEKMGVFPRSVLLRRRESVRNEKASAGINKIDKEYVSDE